MQDIGMGRAPPATASRDEDDNFSSGAVAAGVDILQTFQPKAGNDFAAAYAQYGDRLCFNTA